MSTADQKILSVCLLILTSIAIMLALIFTKPVLMPFVLAVFIYSLSSPLIEWITLKYKVPRLVAVIATLAMVVVAMGLVVALIAVSIEDFVNSAGKYNHLITQASVWATENLSKLGFSFDNQNIMQTLKKIPIVDYAKQLTGGVISFVGNAVLVLIFSMFMILGEQKEHSPDGLFSQLQKKISKYIGTKILTSFATAILVFLVLSIFSVDLAFMFSVLTFLFNFIPTVGSLIATALPIPVLLLQFGLGWQLYVVFVLCGAIQVAIGNVFEPRIMGENMNLNPITVMLFLMFWGLVWGISGMFLAVPITAILKIILLKIKPTRFLAELM